MSSITLPARAEIHPHIRPLNILKDLTSVADLIELCFSNTMDRDGKRYVQDMRRAGNDNPFIEWAARAAESTSLPLTGYVWEEHGKIIGNVSLVPFRHEKKKIYLIANVAVHPQHRRRGIARALTERAIHHSLEKNIRDIWLHVRDDNAAAIQLYTSLGFVEQARRTSWSALTDLSAADTPSEFCITKRNPSDWETQRKWLDNLYPPQLAWHRTWDFNALKPGPLNWLKRILLDINIHQWAAYQDNKFQAALAWLPGGRGSGLFAALGENSPPLALTSLLKQARHDLFHFYPRISLDFPAGHFDTAIQNAGFTPARTLLWMKATL